MEGLQRLIKMLGVTTILRLFGGGIKGGISYGSTDDFGYYVKENPVIVRDMHATILNALGMDHENLTYRFQGLDQRLTGTEPAKVHHQLFG